MLCARSMSPRRMTALDRLQKKGQTRTSQLVRLRSALPPTGDIGTGSVIFGSSSSGNFAILDATRRASSLVRSLDGDCRPCSSSKQTQASFCPALLVTTKHTSSSSIDHGVQALGSIEQRIESSDRPPRCWATLCNARRIIISRSTTRTALSKSVSVKRLMYIGSRVAIWRSSTVRCSIGNLRTARMTATNWSSFNELIHETS